MPSALATDLYEIAMVAGYHAHGLGGAATFELYVRGLPPTRSFLVAAGLEQALEYLGALHFTPDEIAYLRALPNLRGIPGTFFDDYLAGFRFTGDVWAIPEGTPAFPPAPLLRVTAPLPEAQLVETALLSTVMFQTGVASKAARVVDAAQGRSVIEFGARRAHGVDAAALRGARRVHRRLRGDLERRGRRALRHPALGHDGALVGHGLRVRARGVRALHRVVRRSRPCCCSTPTTRSRPRASSCERGFRPSAVRLDSGDLAALSREVRAILDAGGLQATKILGERRPRRTAHRRAGRGRGAPIDGFGVGAAISTVGDVPSLGGVYKLVEIERDGVADRGRQAERGQADVAGSQAGVAPHRRRRRRAAT